MGSDPKIYNFQEVKKHDTANDCWLIISGKVYNITPFLNEHPGGDDVLLSSTGKDATNDFDDVGHSDNARDMMDQYCIGKIDANTLPETRNYIPPQTRHIQYSKTPEFLVKVLQFLVPLLILAVAFAARHFTKKE